MSFYKSAARAMRVAAVGLPLLLPRAACASINPSTSLQAVKTTTPPPSEATFTGAVWNVAVRANDFENATTREPAAEVTTALLLYDDRNLYVGFDARQPGIPITETQASNDIGYGLDDEVTVSIDTSGNNSRVYAFTATPRGVRYEFSSESTRYQPLWSAIASVASDGYRVLMIIPLADLRVGNGTSQRWRINFSRYVAAKSDLLTWAYDAGSTSYCNRASTGPTIYCDSTRWPVLDNVALTKVAKAPAPYADVYGLEDFGGDRKVFETTPQQFVDGTVRNAGIDATIPFTRSLAFVAAIGPDFSNVEADQVTIAPQEFPIQYAEYRPFFAQGANFVAPISALNVVQPNNQMFYSPSLGILDDGFKVEGTVGQGAVGVLDAKGNGFNDRAFGYQFAKPDGTLTLSLEGVAANHQDVIDRTYGVAAAFQNLHSGLTTMINFEQETGTLVGSPDVGRQLIVGEMLDRGAFTSGFFYTDIGPEFSPIDGYTATSDVRGFSGFLHYEGPAPAQTIVKSYEFGSQVDRFLDRSGTAHQVDATVHAAVVFKNLLSIDAMSDTSESRGYSKAYPLYVDPSTARFDSNTLTLGYSDGTPSPTDAFYTFGPFAVVCDDLPAFPLPCATATDNVSPAYTQAYGVTSTRALGHGLSLTAQYNATTERPFAGTADAQFLRRLSLGRSLGSDSQIAANLQQISGTGGSAAPGESLAISFHERFGNQSQLYLEYGSPAAYRTLQRFVVKYILHVGRGGAGT